MIFFFRCYLTSQLLSTLLGQLFSLTNPMLISVFLSYFNLLFFILTFVHLELLFLALYVFNVFPQMNKPNINTYILSSSFQNGSNCKKYNEILWKLKYTFLEFQHFFSRIIFPNSCFHKAFFHLTIPDMSFYFNF